MFVWFGNYSSVAFLNAGRQNSVDFIKRANSTFFFSVCSTNNSFLVTMFLHTRTKMLSTNLFLPCKVRILNVDIWLNCFAREFKTTVVCFFYTLALNF